MVIRRYAPNDRNEVVELINLCGQSTTAEELDRDLDEPGERGRDNAFVCELDGRIVGDIRMCFVPATKTSHFHVFCFGEVHPDYRRRGIGLRLYTFARQHLHTISRDERCTLTIIQQLSTDRTDQCTILRKAGFQESIRILGMQRLLSSPVPNVLAPSGFTIRESQRADAASIAFVYNQAFAWRPVLDAQLTVEGVVYEFEDANYVPSLYPVITDAEGNLVGFAHGLCTPVEDGRKGTIQTIAVLPEYHGRGLGKALLYSCLHTMQAMDVHRVGLSYELDNTSVAPHLYRSAGFIPYKQWARYTLSIEPRA